MGGDSYFFIKIVLMMLMCNIDILNYFLRYNRSILHIVLLGYAMMVLLSVCLVFLAMLDASADF